VDCEPLIDAKDAAELLGIHERTLRDRASAREIPGFRIGTRWKFRASVLDEWIRTQLSSPNHPRQHTEER
jgi:excisionase family DNA binding protein